MFFLREQSCTSYFSRLRLHKAFLFEQSKAPSLESLARNWKLREPLMITLSFSTHFLSTFKCKNPGGRAQLCRVLPWLLPKLVTLLHLSLNLKNIFNIVKNFVYKTVSDITLTIITFQCITHNNLHNVTPFIPNGWAFAKAHLCNATNIKNYPCPYLAPAL